MLVTITKNDIKSKYAGSVLGFMWVLFYPLLFLGTYSLVYLFIFKVKVPNLSSFEYVLVIFCGLVPFLGFSEALAAGSLSVLSNANLIKNTMFPIELVPVKAVLSSLVTQIVGMSLLVMILFFKDILGVAGFFIIYTFILQIMFTIGIIWILSGLIVLVRDLIQIIPVVILILMMFSPIAYTEEMIPSSMKILMYPNPLYYMITLYRVPLMDNRLPSVYLIAWFTFLSVGFFVGGYYFFSKLKQVMADYV